MAIAATMGPQGIFKRPHAFIGRNQLGKGSIDPGVGFEEGQGMSDPLCNYRIAMNWPDHSTSYFERLSFRGADRQIKPGRGAGFAIGIKQGGTTESYGRSEQTGKLRSSMRRATLTGTEGGSRNARCLPTGSLLWMGALSAALFWCSSGTASEVRDERGQPKVPPMVEMIWTPLAQCGWELSLRNTTPLGQLIWLRTSAGTEDYRLSPALPRILFLPPGAPLFVTQLACTGDSAPDDFKGISWNSSWSPPPVTARHAAQAVCQLPFAVGTLVTVGQDAYGTCSHHNRPAPFLSHWFSRCRRHPDTRCPGRQGRSCGATISPWRHARSKLLRLSLQPDRHPAP